MTKDNVINLVRENIKNLIPYQSARRIGGHGTVCLNANESPIPVFFTLKKKEWNRYPECQPTELISAYANYVNIEYNNVLVTRGADEGIELLIKAFCEPRKDVIVYCPPTYDMYQITANIFDVLARKIPTKKNIWQLDLINIQLNLHSVKIIYICNPNNPTGTIILQNDIIKLLNITAGKALIVVDEAYIEFSLKDSMITYLKKYSHLVILRTLSKAFSLAAIRCGFILANKEVINILNKVISPYPISIPVTDIACQSLESKSIELMKKRVLSNDLNRIWFMEELKTLPCTEKIFDSSANYVLVQFKMCEKIFKELWSKGIILRNQNKKMYLKNCIRISIGTRTECIYVIDELKRFCLKNNIMRNK
ncbi:histidinol-phosphate transaminase [Buchnera aphidicola]|uniref:histidinol-phosphate transaminase n=1 Tax=Buchnera aphidicola TaxID=9 RepID=UPI003463E18A